MIDNNLNDLIGSISKDIRDIHEKLMSEIPESERSKVQSRINDMINKAKSDQKSPNFNDIIDSVYGD